MSPITDGLVYSGAEEGKSTGYNVTPTAAM